MKHLILLIGILFIKTTVASIVLIDSIVTTKDSTTINLIADSCIEAEPISTTKVESNMGKAQKQLTQKLAACWLCDVVDNVIDVAGNILTGGLWQPTWGHYEEGGQRITGPYTIFQQSQGIEADQYILRIRQRIQNPDSL